MIDQMYSVLELAKYNVVHDFPGGATQLGPLVGMNPGTLSNKVNPRVETHHLTVDESVMLQNAARDFRILQAEAMTLNHVCIPLGGAGLLSDAALLNVYADFHAQVGRAAQKISAALIDDKVYKHQAEAFRKEMFTVFEAGLELCRRLESIVDA